MIDGKKSLEGGNSWIRPYFIELPIEGKKDYINLWLSSLLGRDIYCHGGVKLSLLARASPGLMESLLSSFDPSTQRLRLSNVEILFYVRSF